MVRRGLLTLLFGSALFFSSCQPGVALPTPSLAPSPKPTLTPTTNPTSTPTPPKVGEVKAVPTRLPADSTETLTWEGLPRTYIVHYPPTYHPLKPVPLVLFLHGRGGNASSSMGFFGLNQKSDQVGFLAVYPEALGEPKGWNAGFNARDETADDLGFLKALIATLRVKLPVDPKRIYACGFSSGAMMTYRLGVEIPEQLAAIGVVGGAIGSFDRFDNVYTVPNPPTPLPVVIIHGRQDDVVLYGGGRRQDPGNSPIVGYLGVNDAVSFWVKQDGCRTPPVISTITTGVTLNDYPNCLNGTQVAFYSLQNGRHEWFRAGASSISATDVIWNFFTSRTR